MPVAQNPHWPTSSISSSSSLSLTVTPCNPGTWWLSSHAQAILEKGDQQTSPNRGVEKGWQICVGFPFFCSTKKGQNCQVFKQLNWAEEKDCQKTSSLARDTGCAVKNGRVSMGHSTGFFFHRENMKCNACPWGRATVLTFSTRKCPLQWRISSVQGHALMIH